MGKSKSSSEKNTASSSNTSEYVWMNNVSSKMLHPRTSVRNGLEHDFTSLSFSCEKSKSGLGNVSLNNVQVKDATHKDGSLNGYKNIFLGKKGQIRNVSILTDAGYSQIKMTCEEILECFEVARAKYKATHAA